MIVNSSCSSNSISEELVRKSNQELLIEFYHEWNDVPHKWGGNSKKGIDCSGLVQIAYRSLFQIQLPRTTTNQAKVAIEIERSEMKPGDLLFFKIKNRNDLQHVGIYLEGNKMLHASTSKGVVISSLDNPYWKTNYWKTVNILN